MTNMASRAVRASLMSLLAFTAGSGCTGVRRELTVESVPPGALVYLNGDEVGRTPMTREFTYYGTLDLQLRKEGYRTLSARPRVWAPLWQIPPVDLLAEAFPLSDRHKLSYTLKPQAEGDLDKPALIDRAARLASQLRSSEVKAVRESEQSQTQQPVDEDGG